MDLPLISHPTANRVNDYPAEHLTAAGDLRLTAHSEVVAERATRLFKPTDDRRAYLRAAATLHDFGKATTQFQEYVRPTESHDGPEEERYHARLGSLATWFVLGELGASPQDQLAATLAVARHHQALPDAAPYTGHTLTESIASPAITRQCEGITDTWPEAATELLRLSGADTTWETFSTWVTSGDATDNLQSVSTREELTGRKPDKGKLPSELYDRTLHYWAAITLADKSHAMEIPADHVFDLNTLDKQTIESYIADLRSTPAESELETQLNDERERARRQAISGVHEWITNGPAISTLTLPTGLGKTFTGLSAAFESRDIQSSSTDARPIIYALPFTSIIEQTKAIFENPDLWGADPKKSALTVHHYLSETVVYHDERDSTDVVDSDAAETAELLGEAWRDGMVLTTFVQLFESLTGPSNRQGLKLSALDEGLVILDEPQALPKDWWDAIQRLLNLLTKEYGAQIIAMTATQPSLFRELETLSLLEAGHTHNQEICRYCQEGPEYPVDLPTASEAEYFHRADRVQYRIDETALSRQLAADNSYIGYRSAAKRIVEATSETESTLAICNTIESSSVLSTAVCDEADAIHLGESIHSLLAEDDFDAIAARPPPSELAQQVLTDLGLSPSAESSEWVLPDGRGPLVLTLNSRYRPYDRQVIIELAESLSTSPVPFILVSTQAIEAGVDLSFKTVYRDLAPLDSIVQAAGRCNRSYEWGQNGGEVIVWTLAAPNDPAPRNPSREPPAYWVYERGATDDGIPGHLQLISDVLDQYAEAGLVSDVQFSKHAVESYFDALQRKSLSSKEIRERIDVADAGWLAQQSLIGGYETVDVLVAISDAEQERVEALSYRLAQNETSAYEDLASTSNIRVSLPVSDVGQVPGISRLDGKDPDAEGLQMYWNNRTDGLHYSLANGGLRGDSQAVGDSDTNI